MFELNSYLYIYIFVRGIILMEYTNTMKYMHVERVNSNNLEANTDRGIMFELAI